MSDINYLKLCRAVEDALCKLQEKSPLECSVSYYSYENSSKKCTECNAPCITLLNNLNKLYDLASPVTVNLLQDFLAEFLPELDIPIDTLATTTPFRCPELQIDIYTACTITSCEFFTNNRWTGNCILKYISLQNQTCLDANEIRFLLGISQFKLRKISNSAFSKLRHAALKNKTKEEKENSENILIYSEGCSVCGNSCNEPENIYKMTDGFVYCSEECYNKKLPIELRLERIFGIPIRKLLEITNSSFHGIRRASNALQVSPSELTQLLSRHNIQD